MALRSVVSMIYFGPNRTIFSVKFAPASCIRSIKTLAYPVCNVLIPQTTFKTKANDKGSDDFNQAKAKLVVALNFRSVEDALPFYKLPIETLIHIHKTIKNDENQGIYQNRLYYISSRLKVPPAILSEKIAKRHFIYDLSFEWIEKALDVLLEMGVSNNRILRDLWVLKYHHETIRERLQMVKDMGIDKLCPWMVRCTEDILKRFISISQETKDILGETKTTQVYLASRLNTSVDTIEQIYVKTPALKTIRVTKVKSFLDFLLDEGFNTDDIVKKPRVLCASQETVKQRIEKLRQLGITYINLNVLCRSKKGFKKYCDSITSIIKESKYRDKQHEDKLP